MYYVMFDALFNNIFKYKHDLYLKFLRVRIYNIKNIKDIIRIMKNIEYLHVLYMHMYKIILSLENSSFFLCVSFKVNIMYYIFTLTCKFVHILSNPNSICFLI